MSQTIQDKYKLSWSLRDSQLDFYLSTNDSDTITIHSGPVSQRHLAPVSFYLITELGLTLSEAKILWYLMIKTFGEPPFVDSKEYVNPVSTSKAKFCQCGHFLYEHNDYQTPGSNTFGLIKLGCLKCACTLFKQQSSKDKTYRRVIE